MNIRRAELNDLKSVQELNNQLFDLEIAHFDEHLIKDWPLSKDGEQYFKKAIENNFVIVAETAGGGGSRLFAC